MAKKRSFKPNWLVIGGGLAAAYYVWKSQTAKVVAGIAGGKRLYIDDSGHLPRLMSFDPILNQDVWIATIYEGSKAVLPTHGYFYPHPLGKKAKNWAIRNGYKFLNQYKTPTPYNKY